MLHDLQGDLQDNQAGTGMGEGQGNKDVSDQIEDEEQLLGTRSECSVPAIVPVPLLNTSHSCGYIAVACLIGKWLFVPDLLSLKLLGPF